jgi:hypothetical protein
VVQTNQTFGTLPSPFEKLASDIREGLGADFKIIVGDKSIPVSKLVLASSSPVFKTMIYEVDMKESHENSVSIDDFGHDVVLAMVNFLLTYHLEEVEHKTVQLLSLAHKYDIKALQLVCEHVLGSSITRENCLEYLFLADKYDGQVLRHNVVDFFTKNRDSLSETDLKELGSDSKASIIRALILAK